MATLSEQREGLLRRFEPSFQRFGWAVYLCVTTVLGLAYLLLKGTAVHSGPVFNLIGLSSVAAIVTAIRVHRTASLSWGLIAGGLATFVAGDVLAYNYTRFFGVALPFPSVADGFYLATGPLLIAGMVSLIRKRNPSHDRAALIDALILAISAGALSWTFLIAPYAHDTALSLPTKLTSIAYPLMDICIGACVARLALGQGRRSPSFFLLTAGVTCLLATDSIYGWKLLHGGYTTGGLLDGGWIAFYVLIGAAALHPNSRSLVEPAPDRQFRLTPRRIVALGSCAIITPCGLAVTGLRSSPGIDVTLLAASSGAVFLLVFVRLLDLGRRYEGGLRRATVLAEAGVRLVAARTAVEVEDVSSTARHAMLEGTRKRTTDAHVLDPDTVEGVRALASAASLAVGRIEVAEQLLRQRTEARFQTLVQHSSDAILVVDASGQIDYASPSAARVLREEGQLEHRLLADLVQETDRPRIAQVLLASAGDGSTQTLEFALTSARGDLEVEAACTNLLGNDEIRGIVFNIRDISERKRFERELAHQAFHDELTGLANRALFHDRVEHALARVRRGSSIAVLFLDVDDFKTVNDTLGHQIGDQLIRVVADRITRNARSIDTAARLGGDEFAILVEDDGEIDPVEVAERLLETIGASVSIDGNALKITASAGIARARAGEAVSVDDLLRNADLAMYSAKAAGKGTSRLFEPEMHLALLGRLEAKQELELAIERGEFELHYQPIVDLTSGAFVSLEALIRWRHPVRGLVPPDAFIPLAEETGAIVPIGLWVLKEACAEAAKLQRLAGAAAPTVSVNISGRQLQEPELVGDVLNALYEAGLSPERLVLEITETVMISDVDLALGRLHELSEHGIQLAVDDFGSGYSSLNYIRRFPIDILKIDRAFTADASVSDEVAALTETILSLAHILGVTTVAEGIERPDQLEKLRELGCELGQGFLFMKPVEAVEIEREIVRRATLSRAA